MQVRPLVRVTQLSGHDAFIMVTMMLFIALSLALAYVAFVQNDELSEDGDGDSLAINSWAAIWLAAPFFQMLSILIPWIGILVLILCVAYLGGGTLAPP
jgi:hypothetical protein